MKSLFAFLVFVVAQLAALAVDPLAPPAYRPPFKAIASGTNVFIAPGTITWADSSVSAIPAQTVGVAITGTSYLMLGQESLCINDLQSSLGDGGILIATVSRSGSTVTVVSQPNSFSPKRNPFGDLMKNAAAGITQRILVMSDSLGNTGADDSTGVWPNLVFKVVTSDLTNYYEIPGRANTVCTLDAVGGSSAERLYNGFATFTTQNTTAGAGFLDQCLTYNKAQLTYGKSNKRTLVNSRFARPPDALFICVGANVGPNGVEADLDAIETTVKEFASVGAAIGILTESKSYFVSDTAATRLPALRSICDRYGGALIDTASYDAMINAGGTNTFLDGAATGVHKNQMGHYGYAAAIRDVCTSRAVGSSRLPITASTRRIYHRTSGIQAKQVPNACEISFVAGGSSGGATRVAGATSQNIASELGGLSSGSACIYMPNGSATTWQFAPPIGKVIAVVEYQPGTNATVSVTANNGGTTLKSSVSITGGSTPYQEVTLLDYSDVEAYAGAFSSFYTYPARPGLGFKLTVTSGTLYLQGIKVLGAKKSTLYPSGWIGLGTGSNPDPTAWTMENSVLGGSDNKWYFSDTLNTQFYAAGDCNGLMVSFYSGAAGGQLTTYYDGLQGTQIELYVNQSLGGGGAVRSQQFYFDFDVNGRADAGYGFHSALFQYTGNNASIVSPVANQGHPLAIYDVERIDWR